MSNAPLMNLKIQLEQVNAQLMQIARAIKTAAVQMYAKESPIAQGMKSQLLLLMIVVQEPLLLLDCAAS